jgi:ferredoxin
MVSVNEKCIWCGMCAAIASDIFQMWDDGLSHVAKQPETPEENAMVDDSISACPVEAISK